jgi:hydroxyacyl-ACP dehydratase HTD2-like protein with hotdog domain
MSNSAIRFDDITVGQEVTPLSIEIDSMQLFFFSAATSNGHRIHYDQKWATEVEGYPGVLVQGSLQEALLARALMDWAGGRARITRFAVQNRGAAVAGDRLTFGGRVTALRTDSDVGLVDLEIAATDAAGNVLMPGQAVIAMQRR